MNRSVRRSLPTTQAQARRRKQAPKQRDLDFLRHHAPGLYARKAGR